MNLSSLRTRLAIWCSLLMLGGMSAVGALQISLATRSAEHILDQSLADRANGAIRGRFGGGPGFGGPPFQGGANGRMGTGGAPAKGDPSAPEALPGGNVLPPRNHAGGAMGRLPPEPSPDSPGSPFFFRRPIFILADAPQPDPSGNNIPWAPEMVAKAQKGEVQSGYATIQGTKVRVLSVPFRGPEDRIDVVQVAQEASGVDLARQAQLLSLLSGLPLVLFVSIAISVLVSRLVMIPVARLQASAQHLAQNPGSRDRITLDSNDELASLGRSFNEMADRMQEANVRIGEALDRQQRFTSDAAHELRTPLTSIALAAENGLHEKSTDADKLRSLQIVQRSASALARMTDLLLSLARIDSGKSKLELRAISLKDVVDEAIQTSGLADDKRIHNQIGTESVPVLGNADAIRQIVSNLLSNAAAATTDDGTIEISQKGSVLQVIDSGSGIAPEHLPHLFDRFYRVDSSRTRSSGGFGLGLAITKSLVEAQGASLEVSSQIGVGTTFFVNFSQSVESS